MTDPAQLSGDHIEILVEATAIDGPGLLLAQNSGRAAGGAIVGTVRRAAEAAAELVGARVVVGPVDPCAECNVCRRGAPGACPDAVWRQRDTDGGLAGLVIARGRHALVLAGDLVVDGGPAALIGGPAALAFALLTRIGVGPGDPVITFGSGAVPRIAEALAAALGAKPLQIAPDQSADEAIAEAATRLEWDDRPRKVIAVNAAPESVGSVVALAGPGSSVAIGPGASSATLATDLLVAGEMAVVGVAAAHPDLLPEVAAFAARGEINLAEFASPSQVPIAQLSNADALQGIAEIERSGRVLLATA